MDSMETKTSEKTGGFILMKTTDLVIYIENSLRNVKNKKWDIEQAKIFILMKIEKYLGIKIDDIDEKLNNEPF